MSSHGKPVQLKRSIDCPPLAVDAKRAAELVGISRAHFLRLVASKRAPAGILLGRRRLWPVEHLRAWIEGNK